MLKRLLIALDQTPASRAAQDLALALAQRHGASLNGIAVVDPDIAAPAEPTPIGGGAYKEHKDTVLIERARNAAEALAQALISESRAAGVDTDTRVVQGPALATLIDASAPCDMVVIGKDAAFGGAAEAPSRLIANLLRDNPRPLIITPKEAATGTRTLIAYDGSTPAMRGLQLFCALQIRLENEVVVASVLPDAAAAQTMADAGAAFLRERGYKAVGRAVPATGDTHDALTKAAAAADAGMIVAGAYGHRGWREWLLGTTTEALIAKSTLPLFIHH